MKHACSSVVLFCKFSNHDIYGDIIMFVIFQSFVCGVVYVCILNGKTSGSRKKTWLSDIFPFEILLMSSFEGRKSGNRVF
jgi:hypothetical protein